MNNHSELPFVCQCCGACCRWPGIVRVNDDEVRAIAVFLSLSEDDFRDQYCRLAPDRQTLILTEQPGGACVFLDALNHCRIHAVKPQQCRSFPDTWNVPPEYQQLCAGHRAQNAARRQRVAPHCSIGHVHVLGHPLLPLSIADAPADAQVFTCHNFCQLLAYLGIPYTYYGIGPAELPGQSTFADCGRPTGPWRYGNRWHKTYNQRLNRLLAKHCHKQEDAKPKLICSLYGAAQADITTMGLPVVEPLLGYDHCWTPYRVFPSYAQQHVIYTKQDEFTRRNRFFDTVIPHFVNADNYWLAPHTDNYLLYLGRKAADKGVDIAQQCALEMNMRLECVHDNCSGNDKTDLIARAHAVLMPTLYVEPFGYVAIEAQFCGTPVITTDWGAFTETVIHGVTGFRCRTAAEFKQAILLAGKLDRQAIREHACKNYSIQAVAQAYASYFDFVWNVHKHGGYYAPDAFRDPRQWGVNIPFSL